MPWVVVIHRLRRTALLWAFWAAMVTPLAARAGEPEKPAEKQKVHYRTDMAVGHRPAPAKRLVRATPGPAELLKAKEAEARLRRELMKPGLSAVQRVRVLKDLVAAVEAAGEDTLPDFTALCSAVSACEGLGPQVAWEQASEVIGQYYEERYLDECMRYCRMVLDSTWADDEARAWARLRVICCHRQSDRPGMVHPQSAWLMRDLPETAAARAHTKAAAGWLEAYLRDDEAIALLDRMTDLHKSDAEFVRECCVEASMICRRIRRIDHLAVYSKKLKALAADPTLDEKLRKRCARDARWLDAARERLPATRKRQKEPPKQPAQ